MTDIAALTNAILTGRYRALGQAISLVERDDPNADRLLADIYPSTGHARIIGVTGSPGSGKSTLVASLTRHYRRVGKRGGDIPAGPAPPLPAAAGPRGPAPY